MASYSESAKVVKPQGTSLSDIEKSLSAVSSVVVVCLFVCLFVLLHSLCLSSRRILTSSC